MTAEPDFLALVGPTATGKTRLSLRVARVLGGEIVSMDSRQVYRGMDVGTAKATPLERAAVPHHGLDLCDPGQRYAAGDFARDARRWIAEIVGRGRVPILVGGTGFYLKVLTDPLFEEPPLEPARRRALEDVLAPMPRAELARWVRALDPVRAETAVAGGRQRMLRTATMALLTGRPLSWWHERARSVERPLRAVACVLDLPPPTLARRIDRRVAAMVADGLVEETAGLLAAGCAPDAPGLDALGYREVVDHLQGRTTLEEAAERTRAATRRYARRQRTWFRSQLGPDAVRVDAGAPLDACARIVVDAWRSAAGARPLKASGASASVPDLPGASASVSDLPGASASVPDLPGASASVSGISGASASVSLP